MKDTQPKVQLEAKIDELDKKLQEIEPAKVIDGKVASNVALQAANLSREIVDLHKVVKENAIPPGVEATKEFMRVIVFAVMPVLIDSLSASEFSWRGIIIAVLIAVLRAIDKYMHENKNINAKGLVNF